MPRRRTVLTLTLVGLVPAFAAVNSLVAATRARRQQLSAEWAARGARDAAEGRALSAADDYRIAQEYARDRSQYRLQLAEALVDAGRFLEARAQLLTLWSETPGDGVANLELGRLAAKDGDVPGAIRFYHGAIDGAWIADAADARRSARLELARFLIAQDARAAAQAELIMLSGDPPRDQASAAELRALRIAAGLDPAPARRIPFDPRLRVLPLSPARARR